MMALVKAQEASSSCIYDVFLSFRGADIRNTFLAHLYTALSGAGFHTFKDDDGIRRGENINSELEKAILKQARSSIIVFSKDYASSEWCLNELVMILQHNRTSGHKILPVFYHVNPSHVRNQKGNFEEAFRGHEERIKMEMDERKKKHLRNKLEGWRAALNKVGGLVGMVIAGCGSNESKFIQEIVKEIAKNVNRKALSVARHVVGMEAQVKNIIPWLEDDSHGVGILVIHGIGGIGKTTIAKYVYNLYYERFETSSFLADVREMSKDRKGLIKLQRQLLSEILGRKKERIGSVHEGITRIRDAIGCKKVLLVIDDVDNRKQLEATIGNHCFHPGSKIILTTRHKDLLKANKVYKSHEMNRLNDDESLELFSWHAFGQDHPVEGFNNHSKRVVEYCGGNPLALEALAFSLGKSSEEEWKSTLQKLETIQDSEILETLRISYDNLPDDNVKDLFLHIACFFIGEGKDFMVKILDTCGIYTISGMKILNERSLLNFDEHNKLTMHQLIRDMGREIVRQESTDEPGKRSRLWHHLHSLDVLKKESGTETIKGLFLDMHLMKEDKHYDRSFRVDTFERMCNLKLLQLNYAEIKGKYKDFPKGLRLLRWHGFPLEFLPSDFPLESLVALNLCYSNLKQIWKGTKMLNSLKILNLSYCHELANSPDFLQFPNLEKLILKSCISLVGLHESIGKLESLLLLNLKGCKNLRQLPMKIFHMKSLVELILSGCSGLEWFPLDLGKMESLRVFLADGINLSSSSSPESFRFSLTSVPRCLVTLNLSDCNLSSDHIPQNLVDMCMLEELFLSRNPIRSLPELPMSLRLLLLDDCSSLELLTNLPNHPSGLIFYAKGCKKLVEVKGLFKLAPVNSEMVKELGLADLDSNVILQQPEVINLLTDNLYYHEAPVLQGLYEYGIYSIFLRGNVIPNWTAEKSGGRSYFSFMIPSSPPNIKIRGLNIRVVFESKLSSAEFRDYIVVNNESRTLMLSYTPTFKICGFGGEDVTWLSNWKIEDQLMGPGDILSIWITSMREWNVKEFGIQIVWDDNPSICHQNGHPDLLDRRNRGVYLLHTGFTGMGWSRIKFPGLIVKGAEDEERISDNVSWIQTALEVQLMWMFMEGLDAHFSQIPLIDMYPYTKKPLRKGYRDLLTTEFTNKLFMKVASFREGYIEDLLTKFVEEWELEAQKQYMTHYFRGLPSITHLSGAIPRDLPSITHLLRAISRISRLSHVITQAEIRQSGGPRSAGRYYFLDLPKISCILRSAFEIWQSDRWRFAKERFRFRDLETSIISRSPEHLISEYLPHGHYASDSSSRALYNMRGVDRTFISRSPELLISEYLPRGHYASDSSSRALSILERSTFLTIFFLVIFLAGISIMRRAACQCWHYALRTEPIGPLFLFLFWSRVSSSQGVLFRSRSGRIRTSGKSSSQGVLFRSRRSGRIRTFISEVILVIFLAIFLAGISIMCRVECQCWHYALFMEPIGPLFRSRVSSSQGVLFRSRSGRIRTSGKSSSQGVFRSRRSGRLRTSISEVVIFLVIFFTGISIMRCWHYALCTEETEVFRDLICAGRGSFGNWTLEIQTEETEVYRSLTNGVDFEILSAGRGSFRDLICCWLPFLWRTLTVGISECAHTTAKASKPVGDETCHEAESSRQR